MEGANENLSLAKTSAKVILTIDKHRRNVYIGDFVATLIVATQRVIPHTILNGGTILEN